MGFHGYNWTVNLTFVYPSNATSVHGICNRFVRILMEYNRLHPPSFQPQFLIIKYVSVAVRRIVEVSKKGKTPKKLYTFHSVVQNNMQVEATRVFLETIKIQTILSCPVHSHGSPEVITEAIRSSSSTTYQSASYT